MARQCSFGNRLAATVALALVGLLPGGSALAVGSPIVRVSGLGSTAPGIAAPGPGRGAGTGGGGVEIGGWRGGGGTGGAGAAAPAADTTTGGAGPDPTVFLTADLRGADEVPVPGAPAAGDPDGAGDVLLRLRGDQLCWTIRYARLVAITSAHVNAGTAGVNGPVTQTLFGTPLPQGLSTVTGCVTGDAGVLHAVAAAPERHYVNLATAEFPGGAVRGGLRPTNPVDLLAPLRGPLVAMLDGAQVTTGAGDPDGHATGFVRTRGDALDFAVVWSGIGPPTAAHLHPGGVGQIAGSPVELFARSGGLPVEVLGVAGTVAVERSVAEQVDRQPERQHLDLHDAGHVAGAVRGQLSPAVNPPA